MKLYWGTNELTTCNEFRYFAVQNYLDKNTTTPGLSPKILSYTKVEQVPEGDVEDIIEAYLKNRRNHYTRFFTGSKLKPITAVLIQKVWGESGFMSQERYAIKMVCLMSV